MIRDYLELWTGVVALIGVTIAGMHTATAESQSTFSRLRDLDISSERHLMTARRIDRLIRRWDETFEGKLSNGRLAERAAGRLEGRVADRLVAWERLHRRIRRRAHLWSPGIARDLRRLLKTSSRDRLGTPD
ncbi:MAG: hypothetical protein ABEN55_01710, partial [Bradymonadaceae bacterium]